MVPLSATLFLDNYMNLLKRLPLENFEPALTAVLLFYVDLSFLIQFWTYLSNMNSSFWFCSSCCRTETIADLTSDPSVSLLLLMYHSLFLFVRQSNWDLMLLSSVIRIFSATQDSDAWFLLALFLTNDIVSNVFSWRSDVQLKVSEFGIVFVVTQIFQFCFFIW